MRDESWELNGAGGTDGAPEAWESGEDLALLSAGVRETVRGAGGQPSLQGRAPLRVAGRLVPMCQARVPWPLTHGCSQLRHAQVPA